MLDELRRELTDEELNSKITELRSEKLKMIQEDLHNFYAHVHICKECSRRYGTDNTMSPYRHNKMFLCPICDPGVKGKEKWFSLSYNIIP